MSWGVIHVLPLLRNTVSVKITVLLGVTLSGLMDVWEEPALCTFLIFEIWDSIFLQNVGRNLADYMATHPRRP